MIPFKPLLRLRLQKKLIELGTKRREFETPKAQLFAVPPSVQPAKLTKISKQTTQKSLTPTTPPHKKNIPARDPKQCCGVFLLEIVDAKSVSGSLHQNPVVPLLHDVFIRFLHQQPLGPLEQDLCMRISCARCPCQDLLSRIL